MVVRLALILKHKRAEWWDLDHCIERDKVGVTLLCARRICRRAERWSGRSSLVAPLAPWFSAICQAIEGM